MKLKNIPFSPPDIKDEEIRLVADALHSGWITTGPKTKEFEKIIAEYCHTDKAVCLNSATAAMEMALHLLGVVPIFQDSYLAERSQESVKDDTRVFLMKDAIRVGFEHFPLTNQSYF